MEICLITPDDKISVFLRITGQASSEITGPALTPAGKHQTWGFGRIARLDRSLEMFRPFCA